MLVIPTLNEEKTIGKVLEHSINLLGRRNVIVIDGNSTDKTSRIVKEKDVHFITQNGKGKGNAIIDSVSYFLESNKDRISFIDGDQTYLVSEIEKMNRHMNSHDCDMVVGDRLKGNRDANAISSLNVFGNFLFSLIIRILFGGVFCDTQSGFRLLKRDAIEKIHGFLTSHSFEIESEMQILFLMNQLKICSLPITYKRRPLGSETNLNPLRNGYLILKKILEMRFVRSKSYKF